MTRNKIRTKQSSTGQKHAKKVLFYTYYYYFCDMKIFYNRHFPFGSYWAINICGVVFARSDHGRLGKIEQNHEYIHTLQQRELLFIGFYLLYVCEWLFRLAFYRDQYLAYRNLSFEREAYSHQGNLNYKNTREKFAWRKYFKR